MSPKRFKYYKLFCQNSSSFRDNNTCITSETFLIAMRSFSGRPYPLYLLCCYGPTSLKLQSYLLAREQTSLAVWEYITLNNTTKLSDNRNLGKFNVDSEQYLY